MGEKSDANTVISLSAFRKRKRWKQLASIVNQNKLFLGKYSGLTKMKSTYQFTEQLRPTNTTSDAD